MKALLVLAILLLSACGQTTSAVLPPQTITVATPVGTVTASSPGGPVSITVPKDAVAPVK